MKTSEKQIRELKNAAFAGHFRKTKLIIAATLFCIGTQAQNAGKTITISGSKFANPLLEKWTSEYAKVNPGVSFKLVKGSDQNTKTDLELTVTTANHEGESTDSQVSVGRLAVLPVVNEKNTLFDKQIRNGIKQDELKKIFLEDESDQIEPQTKSTKTPSYTVYTQTPQSATARVLIDHFGQSASELGGVIVTGNDKYLIESVLSDSTGVTYGNLSLIYDLNSRIPLKGIKILPIDPDNNGRLKQEELVYDNLDQLISFLEISKNKAIPTDDISFSFNKKSNNPLVADFVSWVAGPGQQYNHQFGFLKTSDVKDGSLTQK
jgi:ABC-type phosphate transport system substrate-binding protein